MPAPVGSMLWRHLRVYHVYGANTDVGKTVLTTALSKTATKLWKHEHSAFLKPVSAGPRADADDRCMLRDSQSYPAVTSRSPLVKDETPGRATHSERENLQYTLAI